MKLFLDADGVLFDFDKRVYEIMGAYPKDIKPSKMWKELAKPEHDFYYSLDFMPDALDLWEFAKPYNPVVLTGTPMGKWAAPQKRRCVRDKLGEDVEVITCMARNKYQYSGNGCVLVDDRPSKSKQSWEDAGGVFVTHYNANTSISELKKLGF